MTKQIVIKLNEAKFKPLLDKLFTKGQDAMTGYSNLVGLCIFAGYAQGHMKVDALDNKSLADFVREKTGISDETFILRLMGKYQEYLKTGKMPETLELKD